MATLTPRVLSDGSTVYDVKFRLGGGRTGGQKTETFNPAKGGRRDEKNAIAFKSALEANGHRWPENYVPGVGFVSAGQIAAARAREQADAQPAVPFDAFAGRWLDTIAPGLESGTTAKYRRILDRHILPAFGQCDVRDPDGVSALAISRWITSLRAGVEDEGGAGWEREPLSPKSIRNLHGLLSAIMQSAVDAERPLRGKNPCAFSQKNLPSLEDGEGEEEMTFLAPEEFGLIHAQFEDEAAADFTEWLVGTGLRFSEASALQVRDFDVLGGRPCFRVWRAWKQAGDGSYHLGSPKTKSSLRRVGINGRQLDVVLPHLAGKGRKELVFQGPNGGRWTHSTYYSGRWRPALYRASRCVGCRGEDYAAGIGRRGYRDLKSTQIAWCGHEGMLEQTPRVHDLRHTHVAWLIADGAPLLAISRRLGHKSIQITQDRYGHLLPEVEDDLVAGLEAMMGRIAARL